MTPEEFKKNRLSIISGRTGKPITQSHLAHELGVSSDYIRMLENSKKTPSKMLIGYFQLLIRCITKGGFKEYEEFEIYLNKYK